MIQTSHHKFLRWAVWMHSPAGGVPSGYGGTMTAKIVEGKGSILPGPPKGSGPKIGDIDPIASSVDTFIAKHLNSKQRKLVKVFYLSREMTADDKAAKLRLAPRTMFDHLHKIHVLLDQHLQKDNPRDRM